jgi:hypothetical protein
VKRKKAAWVLAGDSIFILCQTNLSKRKNRDKCP